MSHSTASCKALQPTDDMNMCTIVHLQIQISMGSKHCKMRDRIIRTYPNWPANNSYTVTVTYVEGELLFRLHSLEKRGETTMLLKRLDIRGMHTD